MTMERSGIGSMLHLIVRFLGSVGALGTGFITWAFYYENGIPWAAWTWAVLAGCSMYVCMRKPNIDKPITEMEDAK